MESKKTHLISMNLPVLQNALKRDPESYKEEVLCYTITYNTCYRLHCNNTTPVPITFIAPSKLSQDPMRQLIGAKYRSHFM